MADKDKKTDDVGKQNLGKQGNGVTSEKRPSNNTKGKAPAKRASSTKTTVMPQERGESSSKNEQLNSSLILECLKSIQQSQSSLCKRMDDLEQYDNSEYQEFQEYDDSFEFGPPSPKRSRGEEGEDNTPPTQPTLSRFAHLSKKFKPTEVCSDEVDSILADNVNDLFRKGMDEEMYEKTVKDENCARPSNCEGLIVAKMNKLVWDVMPQQSKSVDRKLQALATSIVKAGVFITKTMSKAAEMEMKLTALEKEGEFDMMGIMDGCNEALALMGHANYQTNMMRRDLLRPELRREYAHLCTHSLPVTKELFGDDISKTAKVIEDCAKIGYKMSGQPSYRGDFRGRSGYRGRYRGMGPSRGRGYSAHSAQGSSTHRYNEGKNWHRRGGARSQQRM